MASPKTEQSEYSPKRLYRSERDRVIAGVAGGLGEYLQIDPAVVRVLFVLATIFGGSGILAYLVLWIIIPAQSQTTANDTVRVNAEEIRGRAKEFAEDSRFWWGLLLMVLGVLILFDNLGLYHFLDLAKFWPVALIFVGLTMLIRR